MSALSYNQIYNKLESLKLPQKRQERPSLFCYFLFPLNIILLCCFCWPPLSSQLVFVDSLVTGAGEEALFAQLIGQPPPNVIMSHHLGRLFFKASLSWKWICSAFLKSATWTIASQRGSHRVNKNWVVAWKLRMQDIITTKLLNVKLYAKLTTIFDDEMGSNEKWFTP